MEVEVAIHETKTFQLPMGIEIEDRCMWAGLQASKMFKAPQFHNHVGFGVCQIAGAFRVQLKNGVF